MADFHQIWSRNVVRCPVAESGQTFSKIFTLGVICPKNLKNLKCTAEILFTPRCSPRDRVSEVGQLFSMTYGCGATVRDRKFRPYVKPYVKFARFSDFALFFPYKTLKTYFPVTSLQPRSYVGEWLRFFHVVVEGSNGCLPAPDISRDFWYGSWDPQTCKNFRR